MSVWRTTLAIGVAAAIGVLTLEAQNAPPSTELSGVVCGDEACAEPLGGAIVTVDCRDGARPRSTVTDAQGGFTVGNLPSGRCLVSARKAAFLTMNYGAKAPGRGGAALAVRDGVRLPPIRVVLPRGAVITGTLRDLDGRPIADVTAKAIPVDRFRMAPNTPASTTTDDRGVYRFFGLLPGAYLVAAEVLARGEIEMPSIEEMDRRFAEMLRPRSPAEPRASQPRATPSPAITYGPTFFPGVASAAEAATITVAAGEERTVDFSVGPVPSSRIEGTVSASDGALPRSIDMTLDQAGPIVPYLIGGHNPTSNIDGRFVVKGVAPGRYTLSAVTGSGADLLWSMNDLTLGGNDVADVRVVLRTGLHVVGRAVFDGSPPPSGLIATIRFTRISTRSEFSTGANPGVLTNPPAVGTIRPDGTFDVAGLMPGVYTVSVVGTAGWRVRSFVAGARDLLDVPFELSTATDVGGTLITLSGQHALLSGVLHVPPAVYSSDYVVLVFPIDRALWLPGARRIQTTRAATDGHFAIRDLPAGDYYLAAATDVGPDDLADPGFLSDLMSGAIRLTLSDGEIRTQNLRLAGGTRPSIR